jgi:hypothetical protein
MEGCVLDAVSIYLTDIEIGSDFRHFRCRDMVRGAPDLFSGEGVVLELLSLEGSGIGIGEKNGRRRGRMRRRGVKKKPT